MSLEFSRTNYHGLGPQKESKIAPKSCENKLVGEDAALHENREVSLTKLRFMGSCIIFSVLPSVSVQSSCRVDCRINATVYYSVIKIICLFVSYWLKSRGFFYMTG